MIFRRSKKKKKTAAVQCWTFLPDPDTRSITWYYKYHLGSIAWSVPISAATRRSKRQLGGNIPLTQERERGAKRKEEGWRDGGMMIHHLWNSQCFSGVCQPRKLPCWMRAIWTSLVFFLFFLFFYFWIPGEIKKWMKQAQRALVKWNVANFRVAKSNKSIWVMSARWILLSPSPHTSCMCV